MTQKIIYGLFLLPSLVFSQITIQGVIYNENNSFITGASVTITDIENEKIIGYRITDDNGHFSISYNYKGEFVHINIRSMGYETVQKKIPNKAQHLEFKIKEAFFELKEVIVKQQPIIRRGDTINYAVNSFSRDQDRTIADVLRRMPGIEVTPNGQILYNGTAIIKYYIEGLDLLDGRYHLANENIPHHVVSKIQILENHQPVKVLDSIEFSDKAALNIQLKEKSIITGQAELASGLSPFLWKANITPMVFSKNRQMISSYQTNNTAIQISNQIKSLIPDDWQNQFDERNKQNTWLSLQSLPPPNLPERRFLYNATHILTTNVLQKLKKDFELRANISFLNDAQKEWGNVRTLFFLSADTISIYEENHNKFYSNILEGDLSFEKNTRKNYLKNIFGFKQEWNNENGNLDKNYENMEQRLQQHNYHVSNRLKMIFPVGKQLLTLDSNFGINESNPNLEISPGAFDMIFNQGFYFENLRQKLNVKSLNTLNSLAFSKQFGRITVTTKGSLQFDQQVLKSNLFVDEHFFENREFINNLHYNYFRSSFEVKSQFRKNKWRIELNIPINFISTKMEDHDLQRDQRLQRMNADPKLFIIYDVDAMWKINMSTGREHSYGQNNQFHYAYILKNYRNLQRMDAPFPENKLNFAGSGISYRNPIKAIFGNLDYQYSINLKNLLYNNKIASNGENQIIAFEQPNSNKNHTISGRISKYFSSYRTSVTFRTNFSFSSFDNFLNDKLLTIHNFSSFFSSKIESDILNWLKADYQISLQQSTNRIPEHSKTLFRQRNHNLNVHFLQKNHQLTINTELIQNNFFTGKNENFFADIIYKYTLKKQKADLELKWTNILNSTHYTTVILNEFSYIESQRFLRPSEFMAGIRFSL